MTIFFLVLGILILAVTMYDFFFTTLSGGGAAYITNYIAFTSHKILKALVRLTGRKIYRLSGMFINLSVLSAWLILTWLGLFFIFSSDPQAIVNDAGRAATAWERLYFTGYTLSTLGLGNFKPLTPVFEFLTAIFSFFGFIFFTTSITYLLSISSAMIHKRSLSLSIRSLGKTPEEVVYRLLNQDTSLSRQILSSLQEKIERHAINLQAYPVLRYYTNNHIAAAISVNIVVLDETLSILLNSRQGEKLKDALTPLRSSLSYFLEQVEEKYAIALHKDEAPDIHKLRGWEIISHNFLSDPALFNRRKTLAGLLKMDNFHWSDVYPRHTFNEE